MSARFSYGNELLNLPGLPYHPLWTGDSNSYCVEWFWIFNKVIYEASISSCHVISYIIIASCYSHNCMLCIYTDACLNCHVNMSGPLLSDREGHQHLQFYLPPGVTSLGRERQSISRRTRMQPWWCTRTYRRAHTSTNTYMNMYIWTKSEALNFGTKINNEM